MIGLREPAQSPISRVSRTPLPCCDPGRAVPGHHGRRWIEFLKLKEPANFEPEVGGKER